MLIAAGYKIPEPQPGWKDASGQESGEDLAIGFTLLQFVAEQGLDPNSSTPQEVCDALVKASGGVPANGTPNGNGEGLSTEAKVAIGAGAVLCNPDWVDAKALGAREVVEVAIGAGAVVLVGGIAYFALK